MSKHSIQFLALFLLLSDFKLQLNQLSKIREINVRHMSIRLDQLPKTSFIFVSYLHSGPMNPESFF